MSAVEYPWERDWDPAIPSPTMGMGEAIVAGYMQRMVLASIRAVAEECEDSPLRRFVLSTTEEFADA